MPDGMQQPSKRAPAAWLSETVADWFDSSGPGAIDLELQPVDGCDVQVERQGDRLTIRGAVVTVRRPAQHPALAGARKLYF